MKNKKHSLGRMKGPSRRRHHTKVTNHPKLTMIIIDGTIFLHKVFHKYTWTKKAGVTNFDPNIVRNKVNNRDLAGHGSSDRRTF